MSAEPHRTAGPERLDGQGLDPNQHESGNLAIHKLLTTDEGRAWTDFVATYRWEIDGTGAYEAWALRGMVRWVRELAPGGGYHYRVIETAGRNPLANQDHTALASYESELAAAGTADALAAIVPAEAVSYPFAYERLSQLFDSPNAPDLVVNPKVFAYGRQPGQHGGLDVIQSRSPLVFSGPGIRRGAVVDAAARQTDVAPTIARAMNFPLINGRDETGRTSNERGVGPDVYFARQDGSPLDAVFDGTHSRPARVYIMLLDGQSQTELLHRLESEPAAIPNLRRLVSRGTMLRWGSVTNFPSITWPSHNAIGTSAWCGHHDIVNPTYYLRDERITISPQGQQFDTARCLNPGVETLFEAFHRVFGEWDGAFEGALTASVNEPCTRGADHASLERRLVGDRAQLIALTQETEHEINPRWKDELEEHGHRLMGEIDNRALAQARQLFMDQRHSPPMFVFHEFSQPDSAAHDYGPHHEGARQALDETDRRIGRILALLDDQGRFDDTLFVITTDHGMALQDTSLNANPARIPERAGMEAITTEPLIYLRDLFIEVEMAHDGRTGRVTVLDNDRDRNGERPPVVDAEVLIADHQDGRVARTRVDAHGIAGFAVPADVRPEELRMSVAAPGFNRRHLRLDGTPIGVDLREVLYGAR